MWQLKISETYATVSANQIADILYFSKNTYKRPHVCCCLDGQVVKVNNN